MLKTLLLIVCICIQTKLSLQQKSPCPNIFRFTSGSTAEISVKNYEQYGKSKTNLTITLSFSKKLKKVLLIDILHILSVI